VIRLMSARLTWQHMIAALGAMSCERHDEPGGRERAGFLHPKWSKLHHGGVLPTPQAADAIAVFCGVTDQERLNLCGVVNDCQAAPAQDSAALHRSTSRSLVKSRQKARV